MVKRCMRCMNTYDEEFNVCPYCGYIENTSPVEAYHIEPGTTLKNRYIVGVSIGYGGFGVTYLGWDTLLKQKVAIKEYLPSEFATRVTGEEQVTIYTGEKEIQFDIGREKFADEAKRLAQFNSVDGVVEIKDMFSANRTSYIVMEYLEGETLKSRIEREGKIPPEEAVSITKEILNTLDEVHKGDIIHRDIAPDNIFLCKDGRIKLLDFGAARYATVQHSKSLSVILKEGYAPEEQYRSKGKQGPWSDVYAVGATLYKMLTGVTPEDAMERAENDKLKPVSKYGVKLSKSVEAALMNSLNVYSEDRTQTAMDFITELDADQVNKKKRTRKKMDVGKWPLWSKILLSIIVIVLVAVGILLSTNNGYSLENGKVYVPEVINQKVKKAQRHIERADLTMKIIGQEKSEKVEFEKVMLQYPDAGRVVNLGEMVEVKISAGNTVIMVDLRNKTREEAEKLLKLMGFTNIEFIKVEGAVAPGIVLAQNVKPNEEVTTDKKIILKISKGLEGINESEDTVVPDFRDMSYGKALELAKSKGLYLIEGKTVPGQAASGTILDQDTPAGTVVKEGTSITVTFSAGAEKIEVPYVEYMTEKEAEAVLSSYGFKTSVSYENDDTVRSGLVMRQSIESGKMEKPGAVIELVVSRGSKPEVVPDVTGMTESDAASELVSSEFRYTTEYIHSDSYAWGEVISYSPIGNQEKGTKVTLKVSCGTPGKLVSEEEYNSNYSDTDMYSAEPQYKYAYREKEYTRSGNSSLSGWTKYDTETSSTTSGWTFGSYPKSKSSISGDKAVYTEAVNKGHYYFAYAVQSPYKPSDYCYYVDISKANVIQFMKNETDKNGKHHKASDYADNKIRFYYLITTKAFDLERSSRGNFLYTKNRLNQNVPCVNNANVKVGTTSGGSPYKYDLSLYTDDAHYNIYKLKTTYTTYCYWRWGSWSDYGEWTDKQQTDDSVKESSEVAYYVVGRKPV